MASILFRGSKISFYNQLRHIQRSATVFNASTFNMDKEKKAFECILPGVINSVITGPNLDKVPVVGSWMEQLLDYTIRGGDLGRGLIISTAYRMLEEPENYSEEKQHLACVLGWCIELVCMLMVDDMMDGVTNRRGKLCWHLHPNVGSIAINDSFLVYHCALQVLKTYFEKTPFYANLENLIIESVFKALIGQHLDCLYGYRNKEKNIDVLTLHNVKTIAIHKTSYYTIRLPILLALVLVKNGKELATKELNDICLDLGLYLQSQDDYSDAYGDGTLTGKTGRDIQEGKCSWVAAAALERCNEAQRSTFAQCYGSENPEHVKQIQQLFDELNIPEVYKQYESAFYSDLVQRINGLSTKGVKNLILEILKRCSKRLY